MTFPEVDSQVTEGAEHGPLVSVVMATYNGEKYLREQLDSIYSQTYKNLEILVCDDCSTDRTGEILAEYADRRGLIYQVNERNIGLVKNFEKALYRAKGEFIALADQDDIWYPDKIGLLLDNIGTFSLIHSAVHVIDGQGKPHANQFVVSEYSRDHTAKVNFVDFLETAWVLGCTSLFRRDLLTQCLPFPKGVMFHDWWLTVAAIKLGQGIKYIHEPTVQYRQYGENTAFKFFTDISWHKKRFEFYKLLEAIFKEKLTPPEKESLTEIALQNAARFTVLGIQGNHMALVEQFLSENGTLLTVPFIQDLIAAANDNNLSAEQASLRKGGFANQLIVRLRKKIYSPASWVDKVISKLYISIFRPLLLMPAKRIYRRLRA